MSIYKHNPYLSEDDTEFTETYAAGDDPLVLQSEAAAMMNDEGDDEDDDMNSDDDDEYTSNTKRIKHGIERNASAVYGVFANDDEDSQERKNAKIFDSSQ